MKKPMHDEDGKFIGLKMNQAEQKVAGLELIQSTRDQYRKKMEQAKIAYERDPENLAKADKFAAALEKWKEADDRFIKKCEELGLV